MSTNTIETLRTHLFATLASLRDTENPMEIERAKAIAEVARGIVDSAKVEVDFVKATGARGSGFIHELEGPKTGTPDKPRLVRGKDMVG